MQASFMYITDKIKDTYSNVKLEISNCAKGILKNIISFFFSIVRLLCQSGHEFMLSCLGGGISHPPSPSPSPSIQSSPYQAFFPPQIIIRRHIFISLHPRSRNYDVHNQLRIAIQYKAVRMLSIFISCYFYRENDETGPSVVTYVYFLLRGLRLPKSPPIYLCLPQLKPEYESRVLYCTSTTT